MLLGKPLFAGSGQLAVLLAIRDCRIDSLRETRGSLPKGLFEVLERALSRDPGGALPGGGRASRRRSRAVRLPTRPSRRTSCRPSCAGCSSAPSTDAMVAVRESAGQIRAVVAARGAAATDPPPGSQEITGEYAPIPSHVVTQANERLGPWTFARLVEGIATGHVRRGDMVDYMGRGLAPIESHRGARAASCPP